MNVFITGGTGFVGRRLAGELAGQGHRVVVLSRSDARDPNSVPEIVHLVGDPTAPGDWQEEASRADAAVNLAGASIFRRWTDEAKEEIMNSRVLSTRHLIQALTSSHSGERTLLSASAVGYYGTHPQKEMTEDSPSGSGFLAEVTRAWEAEALAAAQAGVRTAIMRFGVVLAPSGGALGEMLPLFRLGLGGRLGLGRQWFSWVHREDLVRAALFLLDRPDAVGPFNVTSPHPATNAELTRKLARRLKRPALLPVPGFVLKLFWGEFASTLLKGQKVLPARLIELGFEFKFPRLAQALVDLLG